MKPTSAFRIAALLGFTGVALGAFGAHALNARLIALDTLKIWGTASLYHLIHAAVLLFLSPAYSRRKFAWWSFFGGLLIFSGSLYILSVTGIKWLGAITPIGGLGFLLGWGSLIFGGISRSEPIDY